MVTQSHCIPLTPAFQRNHSILLNGIELVLEAEVVWEIALLYGF